MSGSPCIEEGSFCTQRERDPVQGKVPCTVGPPGNRQTHTTENITFPQLRWRAVTSTLSVDSIGIEEENANRGTEYNIYEMDARLSVFIVISFYTPLLSGYTPLFDCEYFLLLLSRSIFLPCAATGVCDSVQGGGAYVAGGTCMAGGMHGSGACMVDNTRYSQ